MRKATRFAWGGDEDFLSLCAVSPGLPQPGSLSFPCRSSAGCSVRWKVGSAAVSECVPEGTEGRAGRR